MMAGQSVLISMPLAASSADARTEMQKYQRSRELLEQKFISQEAVDAIKPLDCVLVQHYNAMAAVTLLRQFVPPSLLITNSTDTNERPLALDRDDIAIKGVIVGTYTTPYMRGG